MACAVAAGVVIGGGCDGDDRRDATPGATSAPTPGAPESTSPSGTSWTPPPGPLALDARTGQLHTAIPNPHGRRWWPSYAGTWEDERHVLVPVSGQRRAAVVRLDVRSGEWEVAVPWTGLPESHEVTFETRS